MTTRLAYQEPILNLPQAAVGFAVRPNGATKAAISPHHESCYGVPTAIRPAASIMQRLDGANADERLYVSDGSSWTAVPLTALTAAVAAQAQADAASEQVVPMAVYGTWGFDADGARTNGGGIVGSSVTLTAADDVYAKVEDDGAFAALSAETDGYDAPYQLFPDAPVAGEDFAYFGAAIPFPELAFDVATAATFDAAGVLEWEYWDGTAWSALGITHDGTSASTDGGSLAFGQDGAVSFIPPQDWASTSVGGQAGYWIRVGIAAGKAANLTQVPVLNTTNHEIVTPAGGWISRVTGTINSLRINDGAATLHTAADVDFVLVNFTTGRHSGALTFDQDVRTQTFDELSIPVAAGDLLGVLCTIEDGTNEPSNVMLELGFTVS